MQAPISKLLFTAALAAAVPAGATGSAFAAPTGVWLDHTGRGAVEITRCGGGLCGRIVWLKDARNTKVCGLKILGNVKPVGAGGWDNGWIFDPERGSRYGVAITEMGGRALKVTGYAGSKMLSKTMIWRKAPSGLRRCGA